MTQKEISKILGVSVATVSLALRDSPSIKNETRSRVKKLAAAMDYRPSEIARSLSLKKSWTVGLIISSFSLPYYSQLVEEIQQHLKKVNYLGIALTEGYRKGYIENRRYAVDTFIKKRVDGLICGKLDYQEFLSLKKANIFPLLFEEPNNGIDIDFVSVDRYKGAYMAVEHLIKLGRRKIAFLCLTNKQEGRFMGYKDALFYHHLPLKKEWVIEDYGLYETGYKGMEKLLSLKEKPDAVFAKNDAAAIGAIKAIQASGLNVPEDIAVVGFDNIEEGKYLNVPLTTVEQPKGKIAEKLVEIFLDRLSETENGDTTHKILITPRLVIRDSCGYTLKNKGGAKTEKKKLNGDSSIKKQIKKGGRKNVQAK
jgi:DNA-binding LacI/PurR family transcriptional regulator